MKNSKAVAYAAEEGGLKTGVYRAFAENAGTYDRQAIANYIAKHYSSSKKR